MASRLLLNYKNDCGIDSEAVVVISPQKKKIGAGLLLLLLWGQCFPWRVMAYDVQAFIKEFTGSQVKESNEIIKLNKAKIKTSVDKVAQWYENKWLGGISYLESKTGLNEQCKPYRALKTYNLLNLGFNCGVLKGAGELGAEVYSFVAMLPTAPERIVNFGFKYAENPKEYQDMLVNGAQTVAGVVLNPAPFLSGLYGYGKNAYLEAAQDPLTLGTLHGEVAVFLGSFLIGGGQIKGAGKAVKGLNGLPISAKVSSGTGINWSAFVPDFSKIYSYAATPVLAAKTGKSISTVGLNMNKGSAKIDFYPLINTNLPKVIKNTGSTETKIGVAYPLEVEKAKNFLRNQDYSWIRKLKAPERLRDDLFRWGAAQYQIWEKRLLPEEKKVITDYTKIGALHNVVLRKEIDLDNAHMQLVLEEISLIISGLEKYSLPESILVFRGTSKKALGKYADLPPKQLIGKVITEKGLMSTSLFPVRKFISLDDGLFMVIKVPKGTKGAYLGGLSNYPHEAEVLFPPGMRLIIREADSLWDEGWFSRGLSIVAEIIE
jgi:hypothetical protein